MVIGRRDVVVATGGERAERNPHDGVRNARTPTKGSDGDGRIIVLRFSWRNMKRSQSSIVERRFKLSAPINFTSTANPKIIMDNNRY